VDRILAFRLIGYMLSLPVIFGENAMALRFGGGLKPASRNVKAAFKSSLTDCATAAADSLAL